jgi:hypothetical protein
LWKVGGGRTEFVEINPRHLSDLPQYAEADFSNLKSRYADPPFMPDKADD